MKLDPIFAGAGVAIVTPFTSNGVDYNKLTEIIEFQIKKGIDAIIVAGTTGEASTMPDDEHIDVIRHTAEVVAHRVPVIAGTGSNDTEHGINLSKLAIKAGADALLLVTPYYNKASQKGLVAHYSATCRAVDVPCILYNVPSRTAVNIAPDTYAKLMDHDNIVGIKECNLNQVAETIRLCGDRYDIYSGEDGLVVPLMSLGGKGVISVVANIWPEVMVEMTHAWLNGDVKTAAQRQVEIIDLVKAIFSDVNPIPVKEAMNLMGFGVGECRLPLCGMTDEGHDKLAAVLKSYGLM